MANGSRPPRGKTLERSSPGSLPQGCELALAVHPIDGEVWTTLPPAHRQVSGLRKGELRPPVPGFVATRSRWHRLTSHFQVIDVERQGVERAFVHVDQVARGT